MTPHYKIKGLMVGKRGFELRSLASNPLISLSLIKLRGSQGLVGHYIPQDSTRRGVDVLDGVKER